MSEVTRKEFEEFRGCLEATLELLVRGPFWGTSKMDPAIQILNRLSKLKIVQPPTPTHDQS